MYDGTYGKWQILVVMLPSCHEMIDPFFTDSTYFDDLLQCSILFHADERREGEQVEEEPPSP